MVRGRLMDKYTLVDDPYRTGGPARYVRVKETGGLVGFITPLTHNFCESCNRVRLTCTGTLYMCPVSYTHLDVYKRQPKDSPMPVSAAMAPST